MLGKIANFVVNSRLRFARNIILVENNRFRSSQPRQAPGRQAVKKPPFLLISQIIHTHKRQYSLSAASYFLGSKL
jgi:hypothetical protein